MSILSIGDLAVSHQQKSHAARLKANLGQLTAELASGHKQDMRGAVRGNFVGLASLTHRLSALEAWQTSAREADLFAGTLQHALGTVQDSTSTLLAELLQASDSDTAPWIEAAAQDARAQFTTVVATLNVTVAGRTLMGGTLTQGPALAQAETMLAELTVAVAGETTAAGIEATVSAWFDDPGGGFESVGYLGAADPLADIAIGPAQSVRLEAKADDRTIRDLLKSYAMAALVDAGALPGALVERGALLRRSGEVMATANTDLSTYRGRIGSAEAAIATAEVRTMAEISALEQASATITAADPYETAVEIEAAQLQLESLFAITTRMARLTLTEFLR